MLNLKSYEGKNVQLTCVDDEIYEGVVSDYIFAEDNIPEGIEAIILNRVIRKSDGYKYENLVEFNFYDIKTIVELN